MNPPTSRVIVQRQTGEVLGDYNLGAGSHTVGRDTDNTISAESEYVSRHHARLDISANGMAIEDLGSTHGTFVNGTPCRALPPLLPTKRYRSATST